MSPQYVDDTCVYIYGLLFDHTIKNALVRYILFGLLTYSDEHRKSCFCHFQPNNFRQLHIRCIPIQNATEIIFEDSLIVQVVSDSRSAFGQYQKFKMEGLKKILCSRKKRAFGSTVHSDCNPYFHRHIMRSHIIIENRVILM